jgi:hypothetical protein
MEPAKASSRLCAIYTRNLPRKDWNRTSTRCTRSARRAKLSSRARLAKDGVWSGPHTMMAVCRAAQWNDQHCSASLLTSARG